MAKLMEILWREALGFPHYGRKYALRGKRVYTLGRDEECDVIIGPHSLVSRKHAFILSDGRDFYVGDLGSIGGTYFFKRKFFSYYSYLMLTSPFRSDAFKKAFRDEKKDMALEREFYEGNGERFDEAHFQREYFLNEFLLDEKNIMGLRKEGYLMLFEHGDKIKIVTEMVLKKNLLERVSGILR